MNYKKLLLQVKSKPRVHGYVCSKVETKISPIHGLGLFAKNDINKGEVIVVWGGCVSTEKEISKFPKKINYNYSLMIYPGYYLSERNESELDSSDFVNHSCLPNSKIINKFVLIAKRDIKKGEEITSDFSSKNITNKKFNCHCDSKNCRKTIYFD